MNASHAKRKDIPVNVVSSAGTNALLPTNRLANAIDNGSAGPLAGTPRCR
jgi:hypothetical protein